MGIISRKDLTPKYIESCLESLDDEKKSSAVGYWHSFVKRQKSSRLSIFNTRNLED